MGGREGNYFANTRRNIAAGLIVPLVEYISRISNKRRVLSVVKEKGREEKRVETEKDSRLRLIGARVQKKNQPRKTRIAISIKKLYNGTRVRTYAHLIETKMFLIKRVV